MKRKNQIIKDGAWLRKADNGTHINLAELNAVIKGVNLAMKWGAGDIIIFTDSAAVYSWLLSLLKKDKRIRVSGLSEMLVKRRLSIFLETLEAYKVEWSMSLVSTTKNKTDGLTRVPKHWLTISSSSSSCAISLHEKFPNDCDLAEQSHTLHHCGAETTLHFARKLDPSYSKSDAEFVVKNCRECQSTDSSAVRTNGGELSIEEDWKRLVLDVTNHGCQKYLTMVNCGPSRFAIWRNIQNESEGQVVSVLRQIFSQFGPPIEILCDNAKSFQIQFDARIL